MKRLLLATTSAAVLIGMSGAASAQSVLERVLSQTNSIQDVTGVFANTADNIGAGQNSTLEEPRLLQAGDTIFVGEDEDGNNVFATVSADGTVRNAAGDQLYLADPGGITTVAADNDALVAPIGAALGTSDEGLTLLSASGGIALGTDPEAILETIDFSVGSIDGSIDIVARRLDEATASIESEITAIEGVTVNFGNMATTVLGAVNTGEIGLGTNQVVEEALAGSSEAIRSTVEQIGTIEDRTQIAINSALNTMDIDGSIGIDLQGVNASVAAVSPDQLDILSADGSLDLDGLGDLLGSMETTVLGAVNTGTIVSGVNNQVDGTVAGIVGNSATNMFGDD